MNTAIMETGKRFLLHSALLGILAVCLWSQEIPEEAQRHMVRGQTAVKMASSPEDYELAIREFQAAVQIAPEWAAAWYNLGLVQEKANHFREAAQSLARFLKLAPEDPDAAAVRTLVYELEYKAERTLTIPEIVAVLASFGQGDAGWSLVNGEGFSPRQFAFIAPDGADRVKVAAYAKNLLFKEREISFRVLKIEGPQVAYRSVIDVCRHMTPCPREMENVIEVVSKTKVRVTQTMTESGEKAFCEYEKR